jgi:hypothetical protein
VAYPQAIKIIQATCYITIKYKRALQASNMLITHAKPYQNYQPLKFSSNKAVSITTAENIGGQWFQVDGLDGQYQIINAERIEEFNDSDLELDSKTLHLDEDSNVQFYEEVYELNNDSEGRQKLRTTLKSSTGNTMDKEFDIVNGNVVGLKPIN